MARIAYFQPFSGVSGDMFLGALVDAGLPLTELDQGLRTLRLPGWRITTRKELRGAFQTTRLKVELDSPARPAPQQLPNPATTTGQNYQPAAPEATHWPSPQSSSDAGSSHAPGIGHSHSHGHGHVHTHGHSHGHDRSQGQDHARGRPSDGPPGPDPLPNLHGHEHQGERRGLSEILRLIEASSLPQQVRDASAHVFRRLGAAEAKVHGLPLDEVHFHEVGAVDSIVDIVGSCLALHLLGIDEVRSAPIVVGTGLVRIEHGLVPLPAPATLELLQGFPVEQRESGFELTTPTGAALLTTLARSFGPFPPLTLSSVGYGAGNDRPGPVPNALRVLIGETGSAGAERDQVLSLEANIDDMSGQALGHFFDRLFEAGALDVSATPILMKKSRPAQEVRVLAPLDREAAVVSAFFAESTTFGLRRRIEERVVLSRDWRTVSSPGGPVRVKVGTSGGRIITETPEYEDLKAAAARSGKPLKEIQAWVLGELRRPPAPH